MNMEQSYVSAALGRPLVDAAGPTFFDQLPADQSVHVERILKQLRDPDTHLNSVDPDELINLLIYHTGNEALCVQAAHKFNVHSSCQLPHLFLCCNSLREAL